MIPYKTISNFYAGDTKTSLTPMNSEYLNSIIKQISENDNNLDDRVGNVESIISNGRIKNEVIETKDLTSDVISSDSIQSNQGTFKNILCTLFETESLRASNASINTGNITNLSGDTSSYKVSNIKDAYIENVHTDKFSLSDNYTFNKEQITFNTNNLGILFNSKENEISGIGYQNVVSGFVSSLKIMSKNSDINETIIEYFSENSNDTFGIKSSNDIFLDTPMLKVTSIMPLNKSSHLGSKETPFETIESKKVTGSYYSRTEADIAEEYETDAKYEVGTLLQIGDETEGTIHSGGPVLGIVSNTYGYLLNSDFRDTKKYSASIALKGRVPVKLSNEGRRGLFVEPDFENPGYCKATIKRTLDTLGVLIDDKTVKV